MLQHVVKACSQVKYPIELYAMSSKELHLRFGDEQFGPPNSLEELLAEYREPSIKRAKRLLNPLDDHPYLSTVDMSPMANSRVLRSSSSVVFSRSRGLKDATALIRREEKSPGNAEMVSESLAQDGYLLLGEIATRPKIDVFAEPADSLITQQDSQPVEVSGFFPMGNRNRPILLYYDWHNFLMYRLHLGCLIR